MMDKKDKYTACQREIKIRLEKGGNLIADLGNVAAVLKKRMDHYFWVGFYFLEYDQLVLGPFQGTPACVFLQKDKGVCAACATQQKTICIPDVHQFPGHVACDPNSQSEIVVPMFDEDDNLRAVLDVDSNELNAFDEIDQTSLEAIADELKSIWNN